MVAPSFVAAADLHFDEHGPWKFRGVRGDAAYGLSQVVDYCLDRRPESLILLGDLVHRPTPSQAAIRDILAQFDRLRDGDVPVRYVLGDHDGRQDSPALHPHPEHVDGLCFPVGGLHGVGLDYLPRGKLQAALATLPVGADILFTHQKWEEFISKSGHAKLTQVPPHVRAVVTGDYHEPVWAQLDDGRQVWSPGSTHATSVADVKPRQFLVGYARRGKLECEFETLRSRPIYRWSVEDPARLAAAVGPDIAAALKDAAGRGLPPEIARPIVDVAYYTDVPNARERLAVLADRCFLFLRPRDRERQRRLADESRRVRPAVALDDAIARITEEGTPGRDWTLRLLHAQDRRAEWRAIVAEVEGGEQ